MPKSSQKQIVEDEKKVIKELQKNSKESIDTIAKRCGCSNHKVRRTIKRLEKNETIWGYHAVVDETKNPWVKRTFNVRKTYFLTL